jgi:NAD(P)-dependent dehydrogenase (short-subunit alcohol dehydrogenase family)
VKHAVDYWRAESKAGRPREGRVVTTSSGAGLHGSIAQTNYSAAKAGIATFTINIAAELGRIGVNANSIAPSARSRMTEEAFAEMMAKPETGFDAMDPANISPLVVWLGSGDCNVSGRVFECAGGLISLADGWQVGAEFDKGAKWDPAEIGSVVDDLVKAAPAPFPVHGT